MFGFICFTPLHALIAEKIIFQRGGNFFLIYFFETDTEKSRYYANLLNERVPTYCFRKKNSVFALLRVWRGVRQIKKALGRSEITICSGNMKTFFSRFVALCLKPAYLMTMDDGAGRLARGSGYFFDPNEHGLSDLFFRLAGPNYLYSQLMKRISKHYTIYSQNKDLPCNEFVSLIEQNFIAQDHAHLQPLSILLTGALSRDKLMSSKEESDLYHRIIQRFGVNYIIRHPRQAPEDLSEFPFVSKSLKIAEHEISDLSKNYSIKVIGTFCSTVLTNLPPSVYRLNILDTKAPFSEELEKVFDELGIETIRM